MPDEIRDPIDNNPEAGKSRRGFAAMPAEKRQAIARKGGQYSRKAPRTNSIQKKQSRRAEKVGLLSAETGGIWPRLDGREAGLLRRNPAPVTGTKK